MKIYFIGQKGIPSIGGGIETYVEGLATNLAARGEEVSVYTRPYYTPAKRRNYRGVRLISLPSVRTKHLDAITHCWRASWDVVRRDADIVYYQNIGPALTCWIPRLFSKAKVVSIFQTEDYLHKKWGWFARLSLHLGEFLMILFSHEVIAVTRKMVDYIGRKHHRRAHLITNAVEVKKLAGSRQIKRLWGLERDNYIVSISRLVRHKRIHDLIQAYNGLRTRKKLVIVGGGAFTDDYVDELKTLAAGNKNIIFTGNQTGSVLAELFSNAYLFVQPSETEGLSLALLEAMSYKRAVLISDIEENLEAASGLAAVFRTGDIADLRDKLSKLLKRPALVREMGEEGRKRIVRNFSCSIISRDIQRLFRQITSAESLPEPAIRFRLARKFISILF